MLELRDLLVELGELNEQQRAQLPNRARQPRIGIFNRLRQPFHMGRPLRRNDAELREVSPQRVDRLRALANQLFSVNYFCRRVASFEDVTAILETIVPAVSDESRAGGNQQPAWSDPESDSSAASRESSWTAGTPPSRPGRKAHNCH